MREGNTYRSARRNEARLMKRAINVLREAGQPKMTFREAFARVTHFRSK